MAIEVKDVKCEVNVPNIRFDETKLNESERKAYQKQKALLIATGALTVGAAVVSKAWRLKRKLKKKK